MTSSPGLPHPLLRPSFPKVRARSGENPLVHIILAFWALWHCRHARPPDARLALH
ncbi:hypothetical protein [Pseudomonas donghuensis]|uniref:Uncharacterized protein n=1 Tax=Pseudomonas donghuensis TaxID=1163398 RepID=A0AAQ0DLR2_9PSED|nr:hypothetical protein [Pseudomonas donghuensis]MDF9892302.1 hypothetical protein [Pseudomonas vranovensis]MCP6694668.1 hypothetical protein [Pseudomonas donghuensis]QWE81219.1 hypothetical protein BV82_07475 [Pseudomonas donghuensis]UVL25691.1 hypothetical protein LOY30_06765 [Pseudomonas donghuensis]WSE84760.1 hypothetical protein VP780_07540 [Pseudomonas donghuensis]